MNPSIPLCIWADVLRLAMCHILKMARTNTQHYTYHNAPHRTAKQRNTNTNTMATTATPQWESNIFCLRISGYLLASMRHFCHTLYTIFLSFLRQCCCWCCCSHSCKRHCSEPKFVRDFLRCNISLAPQSYFAVGHCRGLSGFCGYLHIYIGIMCIV